MLFISILIKISKYLVKYMLRAKLNLKGYVQYFQGDQIAMS